MILGLVIVACTSTVVVVVESTRVVECTPVEGDTHIVECTQESIVIEKVVVAVVMKMYNLSYRKEA